MENPSIPLPEVRSSEIAYQGFFNVRVDLLQLPHGPQRTYNVIEIGCHAAVVIAETPEGKLLITKEYRHPTKHWLLGCPGGRIDLKESPIEAAKRELLEETGYSAEEFVLLGSIYPFPALTEQRTYVVLAKQARKQKSPSLEDFELIHIEALFPHEVAALIQKGTLVDSTLCTALYLRSLHHG